MSEKKLNLLGEEIRPSWVDLWEGMPEFNVQNKRPFATVHIHLRSQEDKELFWNVLGETPTRSANQAWFPKKPIARPDSSPFSSVPQNKYPIYIVSKGRWESRLTSKALENLHIPYRIVVEPVEYKKYASVIDPAKILKLPFSNLGQGSIPARNWIWEYYLKEGAKRHWILDDNIGRFYRLNNNRKKKVVDENPFIDAERFSDRYSNVALSGLNYSFFAPATEARPPFLLNTRIYSCILINNSLSYRWRGRYNEDTDLSLRALVDGWCTVLFNMFLARKEQTMTTKGGNTEALYAGDGRLEMAKSLKAQHPKLVKIVRKYGRWQHSVNYNIFKKNRLVPDPNWREQ